MQVEEEEEEEEEEEGTYRALSETQSALQLKETYIAQIPIIIQIDGTRFQHSFFFLSRIRRVEVFSRDASYTLTNFTLRGSLGKTKCPFMGFRMSRVGSL